MLSAGFWLGQAGAPLWDGTVMRWRQTGRREWVKGAWWGVCRAEC